MKHDWLHFIGRGYYSPEKFISEAQEFGISRRVAPNVMRQMQWGDVVYCIQYVSKTDPGGSVFLRFPIQTMTGLSTQSRERLAQDYEMEEMTPGGVMIRRECGSYITGSSLQISATLEDVTLALEELPKDERGLLMIGCSPDAVEVFPDPWAMLYGVPFRQGFRRFQSERFLTKYDAELERLLGKAPVHPPKAVRLKKDQFYIIHEKPSLSAPMGGAVQVVHDYRQESKSEVNSHRKLLAELVEQLESIELPIGNIEITKKSGKLIVRWMADPTQEGTSEEVARFDFNTKLLTELPYNSTIAFLTKYIAQVLSVRIRK